MSLATMFSFLGSSAADTELPDIFPMPVAQGIFVQTDVHHIYSRILIDVLERTQGIPDEMQMLLWDNCLASESSDGLVSMVSKAMAEKRELFLVYDPSVKLIRKAKPSEEQAIKADYAKQAESKVGVYITFKNYNRTDMVKLYSALEYCGVSSLYKSMNLSKAIQLKLTDLRASVSALDAKPIETQAKAIAKGLSEGKDVAMDAKDSLSTASPDLTATEAAMAFIDGKRSFYLGLPASYITGATKSGLSDTGEADSRAVERGLKNYYFSVVKPVIEALFGIKTTFESEDYRAISTSLSALQTFEITSDELLSKDNKREIINRLFGLPEGTKGDEPEATVAPIVPAPVAGNGRNGQP